MIQAALREPALPKTAALLFAIGLIVNVLLAMVPAPDILKPLGTDMRNAGLVGMGCALLFRSRALASSQSHSDVGKE